MDADRRMDGFSRFDLINKDGSVPGYNAQLVVQPELKVWHRTAPQCPAPANPLPQRFRPVPKMIVAYSCSPHTPHTHPTLPHTPRRSSDLLPPQLGLFTAMSTGDGREVPFFSDTLLQLAFKIVPAFHVRQRAGTSCSERPGTLPSGSSPLQPPLR